MEIEKFIQKFKAQLEDDQVSIEAETDYVNAAFWDSLTNMVIAVMIEDEYDVKLEQKKLNSFTSLEELFNFVQCNQK